jgi:hypothetical protein|tara:strand:- start:263 stop:505 length:243 start_codon:yes stop_codon:yes gene_type:complete
VIGWFSTLIILAFATTSTVVTVSDNISDIERDARALELYLQDKEDYEKYCPFRTWEQPPLSDYKKTLDSYLPEGCKPNNQ